MVYPHGHVVWADARVHLDDATFVRVQGTTGWLFTRRAGRDVLRELDPRDMSDAMAASGESSGAFAAFEGYEEGVERVDRESVRSSSFPSTPSAVLPELVPLRDIRACAKRHGLREKYHNDRSMVVSFVKDTGGGETARVDVYYATGTIATALNTPNAGKTQSFRRGCAIGDVDRIFADPRDAVGPGGYKRRREHDGAFSNNRAVRAMGVYLRDMAEATTEDEEVKLRGELRDLDAAMRELAKQRETLTDHLSAVEARSREGARLRMEGDLERHRELREQNLLARRGDRWTTTEAVHVSSQGLTRRCDFDFETVAHVALFSPGGWFLSRDGGGSQWENAPEEIQRIHAELRDGDWIEYVATGPEGQWYARGARVRVVGRRTRTPILRGVQRHTETRETSRVRREPIVDGPLRRRPMGIERLVRGVDRFHLRQRNGTGGGFARGRRRVFRANGGWRRRLRVAGQLRARGTKPHREGTRRQERRVGAEGHHVRVVHQV